MCVGISYCKLLFYNLASDGRDGCMKFRSFQTMVTKYKIQGDRIVCRIKILFSVDFTMDFTKTTRNFSLIIVYIMINDRLICEFDSFPCTVYLCSTFIVPPHLFARLFISNTTSLLVCSSVMCRNRILATRF